MITSGLVNQKRARFDNGFIHQRDVNARDTTVRPYQAGVDMPIVEKSAYASPSVSPYTKQGTPVKPPAQVFYDDIFGKKVTPTQRIYLYNMLKRISRGGGGFGGGTAPTPGPGGMGGGRPTGMPTDTVSLPPSTSAPPGSDTPPPSLMGASFYTASEQESFGMVDDFANSADNLEDELKAETALSWDSEKGFSDVMSTYDRLVDEIRREKDDLENSSEDMVAKYKAAIRRGKQPEDQETEETSFKEWSEKQLQLGKQLSIKLKKAKRIQEALPPPYRPGTPPSFSTRDGPPGPTQEQLDLWYGSDANASDYRLNFHSFHGSQFQPTGVASSVTSSTTPPTSTTPSTPPVQRYTPGVFVPGVSKATVTKTIAVNGVGPLTRNRTRSDSSYRPSGTPSEDSRMSISSKTSSMKSSKKRTKKTKSEESYVPSSTPSDDSRKMSVD